MVSIGDLIGMYRNEVDAASSSFYAWKSINDFAASNDAVLRRLNANALVWKAITHSLQVTFLVVLGRVFDRDERSLTVRSFIEKCRDNIDQFSLHALEARKLAGARGGRPEWLDDYMQAALQPTPDDFEELLRAAGTFETAYRDRYQPIRHKVIAHKDFATIGNSDVLFGKTNIGEVEDMLSFLAGVERVIHEWFWNGRRTQLTNHLVKRGDDVREQVDRLFAALGD